MALDLSFEEFAGLLGGGPLPAGEVFNTPREVAMAAAHTAVQQTRGTVLVTASRDTREVLDHLKAIFTDSHLLAPKVAKLLADGVKLKSGARILVSAIDRRPRDLVAHVVLGQNDDTLPGEPLSDEQRDRRLKHIFTIAAMSDQIDDETLKLAALCAPDGTADLKGWLRETFALKDDGRDAARWAAWRAAQRGVHAGSSHQEVRGRSTRR